MVAEREIPARQWTRTRELDALAFSEIQERSDWTEFVSGGFCVSCCLNTIKNAEEESARVTVSDLWTPPIGPTRAGSSHRTSHWQGLSGSGTLGWSPVWGRCCWRWGRRRCRSAASDPGEKTHTDTTDCVSALWQPGYCKSTFSCSW